MFEGRGVVETHALTDERCRARAAIFCLVTSGTSPTAALERPGRFKGLRFKVQGTGEEVPRLEILEARDRRCYVRWVFESKKRSRNEWSAKEVETLLLKQREEILECLK